MKKISILLTATMLMTACVSKKKYLALEKEKGEITSELTKSRLANEELESKFAKIQSRVDDYNAKINSLSEENDVKLQVNGDGSVISNSAKRKMRETLKNVDASNFNGVNTLKDSMNLAVQHNLEKAMNTQNLNEDDDIAVNIDETVVMISISDKMLFNSGSYRISNKADNILQKLADVINSEESIDVMVEGHTDSRTINTAKVADNCDLSVLRATSVVRKLQNRYNVAPEKLIASGRSSYQPLVDNNSRDNRSKNRRTRIILLPNIDKFFALMDAN